MAKEKTKGEKPEELEAEEEVELSMDDVEEVSGGTGAFENVPRVPNRKIDDNLKGKI